MCGICGEMSFGDGRVASEMIVAMRDSLHHRGPDSAGLYVTSPARVGLGFRRLRIVDLSESADQPMPNEDGTVQVLFNGEIYNFRQLRRELVARGHQFRSRTDTEVIVHLYEEKGLDAIADLDGMFAIAIWDEREQRLVLARDRAGKKPLFYLQTRDRLLFASEIKAFFAHPAAVLDVDPNAVPYFFLHGYVPTPQTFYCGVRQVEPGTLMTFRTDGRSTVQRYWSLRYPSEAAAVKMPRQQVVSRLRELMTAAVQRRLVSDVPLGAFLSGGLDSTIVVGLMSQLMSEPVKTFTIGFEGNEDYDETDYARTVARRFGTEHTEFRVRADAIKLFERLIWHYDGPCGDSSAVPTYIVSQLTRRHVTVALTGDGGDELFAGYVRFYASIMADRVPDWLAATLHAITSRLGGQANEKRWATRAERFTRSMRLPPYERLTRWSSLFFEDLEELLTPDLRAQVGPINYLRYIERELPFLEGRSPLSRLLHINFKTYLLDDLLVKLDRCAMANSLEPRSPFLDTSLVEFAAGLPDEYKIRGARLKVILREAFADLLPPKVRRRGKMGFGVPFGTWFRGELRSYVSDLLLDRNARYRDYLSAAAVHAAVSRHMEGRADLGLQLWSLLGFEQWLRMLPSWRLHGAGAATAPHLVYNQGSPQ